MTLERGTDMGAAADQLTSKVRDEDRFDYDPKDVRPQQVAALNERLQERKDKIKLLAMRARDAGTTEITSIEDVVPLLLPHTAYKSYPESFLIQEKWDRLTKWLNTVSPYPIEIDTNGIKDIDEGTPGLGA